MLLDTTQDYYGLALPLHAELVRAALEARTQLTRPLLFVAGPEALFALADRLDAAPRTYFTVPELGHDEFIAQGLQRLTRIERWARPTEQAELARVARVRALERTVEDEVVRFLDLELKGKAADGAFGAGPWCAEAPCRSEVPVGVVAPEPADPDADVAPTPRQLRRLFDEGRVGEACAVLRRCARREPRPPIVTSTMLAGSFLYELADAGKRPEAAQLYATWKELAVDVLGLFEFLTRVCELTGRPQQALRFAQLALEFEPEDATWRARRAELEAALAGPQP